MKRIQLLLLVVCMAAFSKESLIGQQSDGKTPDPYAKMSVPAKLTRFNLDFPGGTPRDLVAAIQKATGKPLNVIINKQDESVPLPSLKMSDVNVKELFSAIQAANISRNVPPCGFNTTDQPTDNAIWYFYASDKNVSSDKTCQYFLLTPYLEQGLTVDDITTAIQTGWKMASVSPQPTLNYHKETKLLIAFGNPKSLETVQQVLSSLPHQSDRRSLRELGNLDSSMEQLKRNLEDIKLSSLENTKKQLDQLKVLSSERLQEQLEQLKGLESKLVERLTNSLNSKSLSPSFEPDKSTN